jgi:lysophospholipase L1-like esterase
MKTENPKTVLLYGDSILWGVDATNSGRHAYKDRIKNIIQTELGIDFEIVSEGLRGRTMFGENGYFEQRDGLKQFGPIFASHLPIDLVIIMLGINDLNSKTRHSPEEISNSLNSYLEEAKNWCDFMNYHLPKFIIVSPLDVDETGLNKFAEIFNGSAELVELTTDALKQKALQLGMGFLDARKVALSKNTDGIHLDAVESKKLALAFVEHIKRAL